MKRTTASDGQNDIQDALNAVRTHLGMEVAYFSEFVDGRSVFRYVDAPGLEHLIKPGDSQHLDDVYCNHIRSGTLPQLIPDTADEPIALSLAITSAVPIGSHVSIPIDRPSGQPYGMFCCLSPFPNRTLNSRDVDTMRIFADLAARRLHQELNDADEFDAKHKIIEDVIVAKRFRVVYQPIVSLRTMERVAFEALCRVEVEPYRTPDLWFDDAARVGLGVEFEIAAIEAAVEALETLPDQVSLSVNASPDSVVSGRLPAIVANAEAGRLIIEITEHARVNDYDLIHAALAPLRQAGARIAIDDAGAGYSGLQHIVQMAPDIIKMDLSLTRGIDTDRARRALASAMIHYGRETGATVVAEGIETEEELKTLRMLGADRGQGYHIGRPGALSEYIGTTVVRLAS